MEIQSFSDIITNSSSEIFIIKGKKEKNQIIMDLIYEFYKLIGRDIDNDLEMFVASGKLKDRNWGYEYKKGDIVIISNEDNSIPGVALEFIHNLVDVFDFLSYGDIERHHLG